jgi:hypothetical protein
MTYCVGWKSQSAVFLAADSAETSFDEPKLKLSTMGEKHSTLRGQTDGPFVQESALKLHDFGQCAVTFAGDCGDGYRVIGNMKQALARGATALDAFADSIIDRTGAQVILAFMDDNRPMLAVWNADGDATLRVDVNRIQLGTINDDYRALTSKMLDTILGFPDHSNRILALTLSLLQSYGIHDYLIERGIGGAFCGLYVDSEGVKWQPDMLCLIAHPRLTNVDSVGSFARDGVWCLFNSATEAGTIVIGNRRENESGEICRQRMQDVRLAFSQRNEEAQFDFVTVLNTGHHVASVIELLGHREHELLTLGKHPSIPRTLEVFWSPRLQDLYTTIVEPAGYDGPPHDLCIQFSPYKPPQSALGERDQDALRNASPPKPRD